MQAGWDVLAAMETVRVRPSLHVWDALVRLCAARGRRVSTAGCACSWSSLIRDGPQGVLLVEALRAGCSQGSMLVREYERRLQHSGVRSDARLYHTRLRAHTHAGDPKQALALFTEMRDQACANV